LAPCEIKLSTSVSCLLADDCASAEMYVSPLASTTARIAGSSHLPQRSSWKLFQDTPIVSPAAIVALAILTRTVEPSRTAANFFIMSSLGGAPPFRSANLSTADAWAPHVGARAI